MVRNSILISVSALWLLIGLVTFLSVRSADAADDATIKDLKEKLILANKILDFERIATPMGHISARIPGTDTFLITTDVAPGMSTLDDIVVCNMDGKIIQGKHTKTFSEVWAHIGVYKKRKDINSVAHTHCPYVIALSMTGALLQPASFSALKAGPTPIAMFNKIGHIQRLDWGEEIAGLIGENKAVILRGHGAVVATSSIEGTVEVAIEIEQASRLQLLASANKPVVAFTQEEMKPVVSFRAGKEGPAFSRGWEYYKFLLQDKVK